MSRGRNALGVLCRRPFVPALLATLALLSLGERLGIAAADLEGYAPVLQWSESFPLYLPLSIRKIAEEFGWEMRRGRGFDVDVAHTQLVYPRQPIVFRPDTPRWNVVILCAESLRADALAPDLMPATWEFGAGASRFTEHISGGNGTRMGVFGLFYGLPGAYWFRFLGEKRGPVLVRSLLDRGYEVRAYTSADFSYPEFERTVFADVDRAFLSEGGEGLGWQRDREQVSRVLDFLAKRGQARPFLLYIFFESPHAPYDFPAETAIRTPYLADLEYLTMDVGRDLEGIRNRYWNAVRHLDTQIERVLGALREQGLLESTIVLITGDHGEEFLEKGRWGHNSQFTEEQIRVPLVLWIPGRGPSVERQLTSHLDLPPTLLVALGATNSPADYAIGQSLFAASPREYALVSDWSRLGYVDAKGKVTFPMRSVAWFEPSVTDRSDVPLADPEDFLSARAAVFARLLQDLGRFTGRVDSIPHPPEGGLPE